MAVSATQPTEDCHPAYSPCIPNVSDIDCLPQTAGEDGPVFVQGPIQVLDPANDPYTLDGNDDGVGCEVDESASPNPALVVQPVPATPQPTDDRGRRAANDLHRLTETRGIWRHVVRSSAHAPTRRSWSSPRSPSCSGRHRSTREEDDQVLVGAGDIASCGSDEDEATAELLDEIPGTVFTVGDNAYPNGTAANYRKCYDPSWGRHRDRTRPAVGNHEYRTGSARAYFDYFGSAAGTSKRGYYSYDLGDWHVVVLNSNCARDRRVRGGVASGALAPSRPRRERPAVHGGDLAPSAVHLGIRPPAARPRCGRSSRRCYEADAERRPHRAQPPVRALRTAGPGRHAADPARGIRQFVVGTGGGGLDGFEGRPPPISEARDGKTHGVLKLTLGASGYAWEFVPVAGKTFTDAGIGTCH